jgi:aryl-alcohol dehydrogenase-like predicted oxidoreductase
MKTQQLGSAGPQVSALALGSMGMSDWHGTTLSAVDISRLEEICDAPRVAGTRYDTAQMKTLDSER